MVIVCPLSDVRLRDCLCSAEEIYRTVFTRGLAAQPLGRQTVPNYQIVTIASRYHLASDASDKYVELTVKRAIELQNEGVPYAGGLHASPAQCVPLLRAANGTIIA